MNYCENFCRTIQRLCNTGGGDTDTILLLPLNGNYTDYSPNGYVATVHGSPGFDTGYFAGTQALHVTNRNYIRFTTPENLGTFSADFYFKDDLGRTVQAAGCYVIGTSRNATYGGLAIANSPTVSPETIANTAMTIRNSFAYNTWHHVAITRDTDNIVRLFVNGVYIGQTTSDKDSGTRVGLDAGYVYGEQRNMYISNFRLTKAVLHVEDNGVYTYPVPTQLYI